MMLVYIGIAYHILVIENRDASEQRALEGIKQVPVRNKSFQ